MLDQPTLLAYRYLTSGDCMARYPLIYHDAEQKDKASKYLVLHEVRDRWNRNWQMGEQWRQYKGVITWNPLIYADNKAEYNMVFLPQFPNMFRERTENPVPFEDRPYDLCAIYGMPASVDREIMCGRYDVPLGLARLGMKFNAYGTMPDGHRPEYRSEWRTFFHGGIPSHRKCDTLRLHRFTMAFENSRDPYFASGWVTEKIYDCLGSACIPIYWGAPNIKEYVPREVFIDYRNFSGPNDLYGYLVKTPKETFAKMAQDGLEFFDTIRMDEYLDVYETLV